MFKPEINEASPGFPELTEKDLCDITDLWRELKAVVGVYIRGFEPYTGVDEIVGQHSVFNGPITASQLEFAMAMTRSSVLKDFIVNSRRNENFSPELLVQNQIMSGMKILDLGSGPVPVFARCCRSMGADVWTADVCPITEDCDETLFPKGMQSLEKARHCVLDLSAPSAFAIIQEATLGNFNLATESNLAAGWMKASGFYGGKELGMRLLRKGGVYYNADELEATLKTK